MAAPILAGSVNVTITGRDRWFTTDIPIPTDKEWAIIQLGGEHSAAGWIYLPELRGSSVTLASAGETVTVAQSISFTISSVTNSRQDQGHIGKTAAGGGNFLFGVSFGTRAGMPLRIFTL